MMRQFFQINGANMRLGAGIDHVIGERTRRPAP
jgi:hypothetical protein